MDGKLMLNNNQIFTQEPDDPTPISEYELWDEREKEYNNIIEQLKSPFAQLVFGKEIAFIFSTIYCMLVGRGRCNRLGQTCNAENDVSDLSISQPNIYDHDFPFPNDTELCIPSYCNEYDWG